MNALIILANIHKQCSFSFLFNFKIPFLSTTKSCMCVKSDTKQKPPPCFTELGLHDGNSVKHDIQWELSSGLNNLSLCLPWPATTIVSISSVRTLVGWVCAACFLIIRFLVPRRSNAVLRLAASSYNISPLEGILFFACVQKVPLLLMESVRGQHLLNHS